jgi:hypothetical protein
MNLTISYKFLNIFSKNTKCYENPSTGDRAVACERTYRQTDIMKLTVAFRNVATAPNS